jgi:aminoglycoside 3-N-acetyltransferase
VKNNEDYDYSAEDVVQSLVEVGVSTGDNIFVHSNTGFFGKLRNAVNKNDYYRIFKEAIFKVIGGNGTFIVPTFSYSFCNGETYDKKTTPGICGFLSEMVRTDTESLRSEDANFSIAAIGQKAEYYTESTPDYSFGPDSFWEKFLKSKGKFCNFNFDSASTFIHYVERSLEVPYRYDKPFPGDLIKNGIKQERMFYHFVYDLDKPFNAPDFPKFDRKARELGLAKTSNLGRGQIVSISAIDAFEVIRKGLEEDPAFLIKGVESSK